MPASKSQLQGFKTCNRLGAKEQRQVHAPDKQLPSPTWSELQGEKPKTVRPKATTGIKSSEAVEETGWGGEKEVCLQKCCLKSKVHPAPV